MNKPDKKSNLTDESLWLRALYMFLFYIIFHVVEMIVMLLAFVQLVLSLFTDDTNKNLVKLGKNIGAYIEQITRFLCFADDHKPFPFDDWPTNTK